jgi:hypothetical protein
MLCVVIKGPKQLCIDIDMCLELLMLGIETLWRVRVPMFDALRNKPITCISIIYLGTTNDYMALFSLTGQFKEKMGCIGCLDRWHYMGVPRWI